METQKVTNVLREEWDIGQDTDTHDDPLLDCLVHLAKLHSLPASATALRAGLPLVNKRLTVELLPRAAERAGLAARLVKRPLSKMSNLELPAILLLRSRKAWVVVGTDDEKETITVLLPETGMGEQVLTWKQAEHLYSGYAFFLRPEYKINRQTPVDDEAGGTNWFWGTISGSWRIYRDVFLASFLINIFALASPFFILNVYDRVIPNNAIETLWVLALGITVVHLFGMLMRGLRGFFIDDAGKKANLKISAMLMEKVMGLRLEVRPKSVGAFSNTLEQFDSVRDFITSLSVTTLIDLPFAVMFMVAVWYIAGNIVYILLIAVVIMLIVALVVQRPVRNAVEKIFKASAQKNAILVEGLGGIETIKMLGAESQIQRAWEESVSYIATWSNRSRLLSSAVTNIVGFVQNMVSVAVVVAGVYKIAEGDMSQGGLIACVILSRMAVMPMSQVVSLATRFYRAKTALAKLDTIMALPVERPQGKSFLHRSHFNGQIDFKNVKFNYPGQPTSVIPNLTVSIKAGERVAIIGPIGSGKTTLGKLLLGLYQPTDGMVMMDGTDIRQIDPAELRQYIGYVPQDIMLFRGTIRDNIVLGAPEVSDSTILRASQMAGVTDIIQRHSKGFEMEIGEQGQGLSGGQRQSVVMARALLLDPTILVFDEPTSSMDNKSESRLLQHLKKILPGKTMIVITHRASLLNLVDRIIALDNGTVVADGPRERVMEALRTGQLSI